ncbi:hypothetical protein EYF80_044727 [Liparis tanakae]|uniref:Uncharacterized protein n=1 Tax=Liparis tanakae TaxID=230148 RepID=A0A4Z2FXL8_9TELE|nr:hypothetical protein EYF80_044727 [Liparis tanakae]
MPRRRRSGNGSPGPAHWIQAAVAACDHTGAPPPPRGSSGNRRRRSIGLDVTDSLRSRQKNELDRDKERGTAAGDGKRDGGEEEEGRGMTKTRTLRMELKKQRGGKETRKEGIPRRPLSSRAMEETCVGDKRKMLSGRLGGRQHDALQRQEAKGQTSHSRCFRGTGNRSLKSVAPARATGGRAGVSGEDEGDVDV